MKSEDAGALAHSIAARLKSVGGVEAVVMGGSFARGTAVEGSDLDLGIFYEGELDTAALDALAKELSPGSEATPVGGWGPWINGGAWLNVRGQAIDFIYRDLAKVEATLSDCLAGRATRDCQPGHPHGFFNHIYAGEVNWSVPIYDPERRLAGLKAMLTPYPAALKKTLIDGQMWQADFAAQVAAKGVSKGDDVYVAGCIFEAIGCLCQALFALNEEYFINEKGATLLVDKMALHPNRFAARAQAVFHADNSTASLDSVRALIAETRALCNIS